MKLFSDDVEFRRVNITDGKTGNKNYYYTFEDENQSFQVFSRNDCTSGLNKGDKVNLIFDSRVWDNKLQFNLISMEKVKG